MNRLHLGYFIVFIVVANPVVANPAIANPVGPNACPTYPFFKYTNV